MRSNSPSRTQAPRVAHPAYGLIIASLMACSSTAPEAQLDAANTGAGGLGATNTAATAGPARPDSTNAGRSSTAPSTGGAPARATAGNAGTAGAALSASPGNTAGKAAQGGATGTSMAAGGGSGQPGSGAAGEGGSIGLPAAGGGEQAAGASGQAGPQAQKKFVGNITTNGQVRDDFDKYWDQITPENEGKWGSVEGTRNQMNWSGLDRVHYYAKAHNTIFKQHTLVWGSQQPSWLAGLSKDEQKAEVEEWIRLFCERYPDVAMIDVVNEPPPHTMPVYMDALGGAGTSGYDWIVQAFKWTRQYCPNAILLLNDYNNIEYGNDNSHFLDIVEKIRSAGAPIDALGAQAHDAHKLSASAVQGFIDKLSATGLPVYITEYDLDVADDADQRRIMQEQFSLFWNDEHIAGITLWGYIVGATWRPNTGLMTSDGMERPALSWLREFLKR